MTWGSVVTPVPDPANTGCNQPEGALDGNRTDLLDTGRRRTLVRERGMTERVYTIEVCPICKALLEVTHTDDVGYDLGCPEHGDVDSELLEVVPKP